MLMRLLISAFVLFLWSGVGLAQEQPQAIPQPNEVVQPQAIPQPNEVIAAQPPPAPAAEALLVAPDNTSTERFGGPDGVFRFVVVGDALAGGLGSGLDRLTELDPRFEVVNRFKANSGAARPEIYNWSTNIPKFLKASAFDAVVVMMGTNDLRPIKVGETRVEPGTPEWTTAYKANVDQILKSIKDSGAKAYWVSLPTMQKPEFEAEMQTISALQRERVIGAGAALIDVKRALTNADGSYMIGDLDAKGKVRTLRGKDGISFTRVGNDVLANLVMGALRRGEKVPELQSAKDEASGAEIQVAVALPQSSSPLFGQAGVDDVEITYEADALAKEVPQQLAPDLSNAGKLGLHIARNSLAQRFYRSGEVLGVPYGRFDDYSVSGPTP